ncbi:MAG: ABC-2 family transporter protein [Caulobacteraceae bacterium]
MFSLISTYAAGAGAAIRASFSDRANFALQAGGMIVNDVFFLALWVLFFAGFRQVGGWTREDVTLLLGLAMLIVSIAGVFFGGYRDMAASILKGEPDALLTQPKPVLARLLTRDSIATAWGDLVMGLVILAFFAGLSWRDIPLVVLGVVVGVTVYVSAAVSFAAMAFWAKGARSFARDLTDFMLLFSTYPGSIFSGWTKVIAYTLLPAGFVVLAPVELLRHPSWPAAGITLAGAVIYASLALAAFQLGLRRYRKGDTPQI